MDTVRIQNNEGWTLQAHYERGNAHVQLYDPSGTLCEEKQAVFVMQSSETKESFSSLLQKKVTHLSASQDKFGFQVHRTEKGLAVVFGRYGLAGGLNGWGLAVSLGIGVAGIVTAVAAPFVVGVVAGGFLIGTGIAGSEWSIKDESRDLEDFMHKVIGGGGLPGAVGGAVTAVMAPIAALGAVAHIGTAVVAGTAAGATADLALNGRVSVKGVVSAAASSAAGAGAARLVGAGVQAAGKAARVGHHSLFRVGQETISGAAGAVAGTVTHNVIQRRPLHDNLLKSILTNAAVRGAISAGTEIKRHIELKDFKAALEQAKKDLKQEIADLEEEKSNLDPNDPDYAKKVTDIDKKIGDINLAIENIEQLKASLDQEGADLVVREIALKGQTMPEYLAAKLIEVLTKNGYYVYNTSLAGIKDPIARLKAGETVAFKKHGHHHVVTLNSKDGDIAIGGDCPRIVPLLKTTKEQLQKDIQLARQILDADKANHAQRVDKYNNYQNTQQTALNNYQNAEQNFLRHQQRIMNLPDVFYTLTQNRGVEKKIALQNKQPQQPARIVQEPPQYRYEPPRREPHLNVLPVEPQVDVPEPLPLRIQPQQPERIQRVGQVPSQPRGEPTHFRDTVQGAEEHLHRVQPAAGITPRVDPRLADAEARLEGVRRQASGLTGKAGRSRRSAMVVQIGGVLEKRVHELSHRFDYDNGDHYEGAIVNGRRHGRGVYFKANGDKVEGIWVEDILQGRVKCTFANRDVYVGNFEGGRAQGQGLYIANNGDRFEGEWAAGMIHGNGIYTSANGDRYVGAWRHGNENGRGVLELANNGGRFDGNWLDGNLSGRGIFTSALGRYEGEWLNDQPDGEGRFVYADASVYVGQWRQGQWDGRGVHTLPSGAVYDGQWQEGQRHGRGVAIEAGGRYDGEWVHNKKQGRGLCQYADRSIYNGDWWDNEPHGTGTCSYPNGEKYEGQWRAGRWQGEGKYTYANGSDYRGRWE